MTPQSSASIGVVTGLLAEARLLPAASGSIQIFCSGASAARARSGAQAMASSGIGALLSFGVTGGLDPALAPGALVLATEIVAPGGKRYATDPEWRNAAAEAISSHGPVTLAAIAGSDAPVQTPAEKSKLRAATGAVAVDMESHAVAAVAADYGIPCLAIRAVVDTADETIPEIALQGVDAEGRTRAWPVILAALMRPQELPALLRLARENRAAMRALGGVADAGALTGGFRRS